MTQNGNNNGSTVTQNDLGGHMAIVVQTGTLHSSLIEQNGFQNEATVTQSLTGQISEVTQTGPLAAPAIQNMATVSQTMTANNLSKVTQSGTLNTTTVMQ